MHFPKDPQKFEFDETVAQIFDDMALRSIPMYKEMHKISAAMVKAALTRRFTVLDVGASTGEFFRALESVYHDRLPTADITALAVDSSQPMLDILRTRFPYAVAAAADITKCGPVLPKADVGVAFYVFQFIRPGEDRQKAFKWFGDSLRNGALVFVGHKETDKSTLSDRLSDMYYAWRMENGYTAEEIHAKSEALKNSMWPMSKDELMDHLRTYSQVKGDPVQMTGQFSFRSYALVK